MWSPLNWSVSAICVEIAPLLSTWISISNKSTYTPQYYLRGKRKEIRKAQNQLGLKRDLKKKKGRGTGDNGVFFFHVWNLLPSIIGTEDPRLVYSHFPVWSTHVKLSVRWKIIGCFALAKWTQWKDSVDYVGRVSLAVFCFVLPFLFLAVSVSFLFVAVFHR